MGTINWYRNFIPKLGERLAHLYGKTKGKSNKVTVTDDDMREVKVIYEELKEQARLYFPHLNSIFYINTDASETEIGAILYQEHGIIGHYSKNLNDTQMNYSVPEKEFLAILKAVRHWKKWLLGSKIVIKTDNKNLTFETNDYDKKINRWKKKLSEYNIKYQFVPGNENNVADKLSRIHSKDVKLKILLSEVSNVKIAFLKKFHIENGHPGSEGMYQTIKIYHPEQLVSQK